MPRKVAFSGKLKKKQLQERRERKKDQHSQSEGSNVESELEPFLPAGSHGTDGSEDVQEHNPLQLQGQMEIMRINQQPSSSTDFDPNKYRLHFVKISAEEMKKRKAAAAKPIVKVSQKELEMSVEGVHLQRGSLEFPKRPPWDFTLSKERLEKQEHAYFHEYALSILSTHSTEQLSYFELNLETWRQLWRVMEISDILLLIADIRYPALHLPPSLYRYLQEELKRDVVIVLNKVDLVPPGLLVAWRAYLSSVFPAARIVCFAAFPKVPDQSDAGLHQKRKKKSAKPLGPEELLEVCKDLVKDKVNLESWQHKLDTEEIGTSAPEDHDTEDSVSHGNSQSLGATADSGFAGVYQKFRDGVLTIGCIGYPNVGKSSLLNGLVGRKVVSVSKTPGHTKHLQTIFLTPTVKLCDCPGLVFPSYVDKSLQILSGIFPIAQVREPYSAVGYLAQRLDLPRLLRLPHPNSIGKSKQGRSSGRPACQSSGKTEPVWSAYDICEGWAIKCGYFTAKASRPDMYRAANQILRLAVEGRLRLCFAPPDYFDHQDKWSEDPLAKHLAEQLEARAQEEGTEHVIMSDSDPEDHQPGGDGDTLSGTNSEEDMCHVESNRFALLSDD